MASTECHICFIDYSDKIENRTPRCLTSCGHTICEKCAEKLSNDLEFRCPFDRKVTRLNSDGVKGLPNNFAVLELVSEMLFNSGNLANVPCAEDPTHEANLYCEKCETDICQACFNKSHRMKMFSEHKSVPILEKPIMLPKCPKHPYNTAEFLCTEPKCDNPVKIMCHTCLVTLEHKSHEYEQLMNQLLKNEERLKKGAKKLHTHSYKIERSLKGIEDTDENFDVNGEYFKKTHQSISDVFDKNKEKVLKEFMKWTESQVNTRQQRRQCLQDELSCSKLLEKKVNRLLATKKDLKNVEGISTAVEAQPNWRMTDVGNAAPENLRSFRIDVREMDWRFPSYSNSDFGFGRIFKIFGLGRRFT